MFALGYLRELVLFEQVGELGLAEILGAQVRRQLAELRGVFGELADQRRVVHGLARVVERGQPVALECVECGFELFLFFDGLRALRGMERFIQIQNFRKLCFGGFGLRAPCGRGSTGWCGSGRGTL